MAELRMRLRQATAPLHDRVDAAYSRFELHRMDGYRAFLRAHAHVVGPLEVALEQAGIDTMIHDWPQRSRHQALLADLRALGDALPRSLAHPVPPSPGWCWGAAYVIEGSRLGGLVLAKRVAAANPGAPLSYLSRQSPKPFWPSFLQQFEQQAAVFAWSDLLAGAHDTFDSFIAAAHVHRP